MQEPEPHKTPRGPDCPSDWTLDRLSWGELSDREAAKVERHFTSCDACRGRLEARAETAGELETDRALAHIRLEFMRQPPPAEVTRALGEFARPGEAREKRAWWQTGTGRFGLALAGASALAGLLLIVLTGLPEPPAGERDTVVAKGGLSLQVHLERGGEAGPLAAEEVVHPGDRLKFQVDVPRPGHLMVLGIEADGRAYPCHPADGTDRSREVDAGKTQVLPGAIRLDDSLGEEWLHLVHCPHAFTLSQVTPGVAPGSLGVPAGCAVRSMSLKKRTP